MSIQRRNSEMVDLLSPDFQSRNEPNFSIANVVSTFLMLPELRCFWPFSSVDQSGNALDLSGQGRLLTNNGAVARGAEGLIPYVSLSGANYLSRADEDGLDITGALTLGGWFYLGAAGTAAFEGVIGKSNTTGNQRAYNIFLNNGTGDATFRVSLNGNSGAGNASDVVSSQIALTTWTFLVARFIPSTEVAFFTNKTKITNAAAVVASALNSTANFEIGRRNQAGTFFTGRAALCFLCVSALPDVMVSNLFEQSRAAFGV